ncbi:MAG: hypothetical protein JJ892_02055 [Balneola sp.]|nr:hypothetical protein [Balneola sp.]MBO6651159.1 hypothetical protein [Balneola sp.]MBO6710348.1 hypothetical protein [Balneola sp.]MBO6799033.1 hypothetical protein [Balneola sp.]MBO6870147.1 hypothetical protein [Balneola sp.]
MKSYYLFSLLFLCYSCTVQLPISNGTYLFQHKFAEHPNTSSDIRFEVIIDNPKIVVRNNEESKTWPRGIIEEGELFFQEASQKWIIIQSDKDKNALEVGGCTDGPTVVDLVNKIYWTC